MDSADLISFYIARYISALSFSSVFPPTRAYELRRRRA